MRFQLRMMSRTERTFTSPKTCGCLRMSFSLAPRSAPSIENSPWFSAMSARKIRV